ncbi:MAG: hypothetical protein LBF67_01300 [Prevotellaceae bacterium]|jgi:hypothetical protein|nr:hypothetical protein [Prevotellaceae bacterium]
MQKICFTIATLLSSSLLLSALNDTSLHFRAAGVDIATQRHYLQWSVPNVSDTAAIKGFRILRLKEDEQVNLIMDTLAEVGNHVRRFIVDSAALCCTPRIYTTCLIPKDPSDGGTVYKPPFRTMLLSEATLDVCANTINLQWSAYQQLDPFSITPAPIPQFTDMVRYHIYGHIGGDTFDPDSAVWLATSGSATSFALPVTQEKQRYHLYVAAVYNGGSDTSYSNRTSLFVPLPVRPQYISLDSVIGEDRSVTLHFRIDQATEYTRFWAEKSSEMNSSYTFFEEFGNKQQVSITDNASGSSSFYRISAVNNCGRVAMSSPAITNLTPVVSSKSSSGVEWGIAVWYDSYSGVMQHAQRYDVYRTSPQSAAGAIGSTTELSINDDFLSLPDSVICATQICYRVEAFISDDMQQPIAYVRSPETCTAVPTQVSMPNAVQPGSEMVNPVTGKSRGKFEPLCSCMQGYTLYIYTPDGKLIYSGAEPWNGREKNGENFVPEATYIYHIKITFVSGERAEKTGTVTVVY